MLLEKSGKKYDGNWKNGKAHGFVIVTIRGEIDYTMYANGKRIFLQK